MTDVPIPVEGLEGALPFFSALPCLIWSLYWYIESLCFQVTLAQLQINLEKQGNKESVDRFNPYVSKHCMHVKREHLPIKIPRTEGD